MTTRGADERSVAAIRGRHQCSIELAAGAGKTHLIAAVAKTSSEAGERTLVLTHTNAGVDALRRRLKQLGVPSEHVRVRTIDGWCFDLVRRLPELSGLEAPDEPDWAEKQAYLHAARRAVESRAVRDVLRLSYERVVVDEYQDCGIDQHGLAVAINDVLPVAVFGDPLQALFDFDDSPPPGWDEVREAFPPIAVPEQARRWKRTNPALGAWLLTLRKPLMGAEPIDLSGSPVTWIEKRGPDVAFRACFERTPLSGTVVALGKFRADCAHVAKKLNGSYSVMEEVEGKVLLEFADLVDAGDPHVIAAGTVKFAVSTATGVAAAINPRKRRQLAAGKVIGSRDETLQVVHNAVNQLLSTPHPEHVARALRALSGVKGFAPYCRDAWYGTLAALDAASADSGTSVRSAVVRARNQSRVAGRRPELRAISRPRLIKGLEYDHAVLLDADRYTPTELYVALTRARRSVTVISESRTIVPSVT
jgi:hypothetical protein